MTWAPIDGMPGYHPARRAPKHRADVQVDSCLNSSSAPCPVCAEYPPQFRAHRADLPETEETP